MENFNVKALAQLVENLYGDLSDFPFLRISEDRRQVQETEKRSTLKQLKEFCTTCTRCEFYLGRKNSVFGRGNTKSKVIFLGDFPSDADDLKGEIFSGDQGELLSKMILAMRLKPEEIYFTNLFKCRPTSMPQSNEELPKDCLNHLMEEFRFLEGKTVIAMGTIASKILARSEAPLQVLRKQKFDWEGRSVFCTHHPRDLLHSPALKKEAWEDLQLVMKALVIS